MSDLISRQMAIEVVQNRHIMLNKEKVLLINDLEKLPSAQLATDTNVGTKLSTNLAEVGTDCISRRAAIDAATSSTMEWNGMYVQDLNGRIREAIEQLPSAQRTGKWLDANICGEFPIIVCDQCNTFYPLSFGDFHNFCPNCGAKMEGVSNES